MNSSVSIIRRTNDKPASSQALVKFFSSNSGYQGHLFIGYPIIGTSEGRDSIDALWVSPDKGLVIFDLVEGSNLGDYTRRQDNVANKLEAKLKTHSELVRRRDLLVPIHIISFAPGMNDAAKHSEPDYPLAS